MDGTVLVADDDRTIRTVLTQALTRAGCKVHATSSLTTLMRWVGEGKGDVVISDVVMPDGNGLEMLPKIAEDRPGLPVIVISAQNTIMTAIKAAEAEAQRAAGATATAARERGAPPAAARLILRRPAEPCRETVSVGSIGVDSVDATAPAGTASAAALMSYSASCIACPSSSLASASSCSSDCAARSSRSANLILARMASWRHFTLR